MLWSKLTVNLLSCCSQTNHEVMWSGQVKLTVKRCRLDSDVCTVGCFTFTVTDFSSLCSEIIKDIQTVGRNDPVIVSLCYLLISKQKLLGNTHMKLLLVVTAKLWWFWVCFASRCCPGSLFLFYLSDCFSSHALSSSLCLPSCAIAAPPWLSAAVLGSQLRLVV